MEISNRNWCSMIHIKEFFSDNMKFFGETVHYWPLKINGNEDGLHVSQTQTSLLLETGCDRLVQNLGKGAII